MNNKEGKNKMSKLYGSNEILDALVDNTNWAVRLLVAEQGYGLNKLVNDEDWSVRLAVAKQGYGLDILVNDSEWKVREVASKKLKERENK